MTVSEVFHGSRIFKLSITKDKLAPELQAELNGLMTPAAVDAKINELKLLLFGGQVPAALDTFIELAAAIEGDRTGLAALQQVVSGKANPADITTAVNAAVALLLGGASEDSNTLKKLEVLVKQAQQAAVNAIADGVITNLKLHPDVRVGSLNAAANAFPVGVQAGLTSVEKFLVYLAQQLSAVQAAGGTQQGTSSNHEQRLVAVEQALPNKASQADLNSLGQRVGTVEQSVGTKASAGEVTLLAGRVTTLENRPAGSALPSMAGNAGKALLTDGVSAYWGTVNTNTNTGGSLTAGSVDNVHLVADIKAGSIEDANAFLGTAASSITGLVKGLYTKLVDSAPTDYNTLGKIKVRIDEVRAQATTGVAANSITDALLNTDVKVGSLATTVAVFPSADQAALTNVGAMIRYIWNKVKFINQSAISVDFDVDYMKTKRILVGAYSAGTYTSVQATNAQSYEVRRVTNNQALGFPATLTAGEYVDVSVVPQDYTKPSAVLILP